MTPREYGHNSILLKGNRWRVESVDENDSRRILNFGYNVLNLLREVEVTDREVNSFDNLVKENYWRNMVLII